MNQKHRLTIITAALLFSVATIFVGRSSLPEMTPEDATLVSASHQWLGFIMAFFVANYAVAWRMAFSWSISMARMLIWAVVAYLCISYLIDLFGEHQSIAFQILGAPVDPLSHDMAVVEGLRARFWTWTAGLVLSLICIGIGFEPNQSTKE